jgi:hypothetical protein
MDRRRPAIVNALRQAGRRRVVLVPLILDSRYRLTAVLWRDGGYSERARSGRGSGVRIGQDWEKLTRRASK